MRLNAPHHMNFNAIVCARISRCHDDALYVRGIRFMPHKNQRIKNRDLYIFEINREFWRASFNEANRCESPASNQNSASERLLVNTEIMTIAICLAMCAHLLSSARDGGESNSFVCYTQLS
jgi:hypothetical protein